MWYGGLLARRLLPLSPLILLAFKTWSYTAQEGLELEFLLSQTPYSLNDRLVSPPTDKFVIFINYPHGYYAIATQNRLNKCFIYQANKISCFILTFVYL